MLSGRSATTPIPIPNKFPVVLEFLRVSETQKRVESLLAAAAACYLLLLFVFFSRSHEGSFFVFQFLLLLFLFWANCEMKAKPRFSFSRAHASE